MRTMLNSTLLFLISILIQNVTFSKEQLKDEKYQMIYMIMISNPVEEQNADIMIKTIRTFGGDYGNAPIILVLSDSTITNGKSLEGKVHKIITLKMNEKLRQFPFADKVYACAQVEEIVSGKTGCLVWLNPDIFFVSPPAALVKNKNAWASLRPVHIQNVGCSADAPISEFWRKIYNITGLDTNKIFTVESLVDNKKIRGYFNSGFMAFNPSKGILRAWKEDFEKLLSDPSNYSYYTSDNQYQIFFHQALLSAVVMAKAGKDRINILPSSYGYPVQLQDNTGFTNKKHSISELVTIICGDYNNLNQIEITEPYKSWIENNIR